MTLSAIRIMLFHVHSTIRSPRETNSAHVATQPDIRRRVSCSEQSRSFLFKICWRCIRRCRPVRILLAIDVEFDERISVVRLQGI
jgi:hypothetical protein